MKNGVPITSEIAIKMFAVAFVYLERARHEK